MINKDSKIDEVKVEILPLLTAKEANTLANSLTKEMELQLVADKIRMAVNGTSSFKYELELVGLKHAQYIYRELTKENYIVIFKGPNDLLVKWDTV